MIPRNEIARIKIAQKDAGLDDAAYRNVLISEAGVSSCKNLEAYQVPDVIKAIQEGGERRSGWKGRQLAKFRQYAKFAGMSASQSRMFLMQTINISHEESPILTQANFDVVMAELEAELELRITLGDVQQPAKIKLNYWRDRKPASGESNTREIHKLWGIWYTLLPFLRVEKQNTDYLLGIAGQSCHRKIVDVTHLSAREAFLVIEALKGRLHQEEEKLKRDVPF